MEKLHVGHEHTIFCHGFAILVESYSGRRIGRGRWTRKNCRLTAEHLDHVDTGADFPISRSGRYAESARSRWLNDMQSAPVDPSLLLLSILKNYSLLINLYQIYYLKIQPNRAVPIQPVYKIFLKKKTVLPVKCKVVLIRFSPNLKGLIDKMMFYDVLEKRLNMQPHVGYFLNYFDYLQI